MKTMNPAYLAEQARRNSANDFMRTVNSLSPAAALVTMRVYAGHKHAEFPQYRGKWDNHKIGRMVHTVQTKLGCAFEKGDLCMFVEDVLEGKAVVSVYSVRNGCDTILNPAYVEAVS